MTTSSIRKQNFLEISSKTQKLAVIGAFAAVAILLNRLVVIPAPFLPFLSYEVWEVPIVVAFLVFGTAVALPATFANFMILLLFPGVIFAGPLYNLIAILSMLLGIGLSRKLYILKQNISLPRNIALSTILGTASRVVIMTIVNASLLQLPPPLGFSAPSSLVYSWLPLIALFNGTVSLYTVPLAYAVLKSVLVRSRITNALRKVDHRATRSISP